MESKYHSMKVMELEYFSWLSDYIYVFCKNAILLSSVSLKTRVMLCGTGEVWKCVHMFVVMVQSIVLSFVIVILFCLHLSAT